MNIEQRTTTMKRKIHQHCHWVTVKFISVQFCAIVVATTAASIIVVQYSSKKK